MSQAIEAVIQISDGGLLFWDARGTLSVAYTDGELGRWALDALGNAELPRVEAKAPMNLAPLVALLPVEAQPPTGTAVRAVIMLARDGEDPSVVIWGAAGAPRHARGVESIGKALRELAEDKGQPRVEGGPPRSIVGEAFDRAAPIVTRLILGGGG